MWEGVEYDCSILMNLECHWCNVMDLRAFLDISFLDIFLTYSRVENCGVHLFRFPRATFLQLC